MTTHQQSEYTRPGAHSAKNARQAGAPNHLQGSGEVPMVSTTVSRRARAIGGYGSLSDCGRVEGYPWPLEYAPRWKTDHHPWRLATQHAIRYASYEVLELGGRDA